MRAFRKSVLSLAVVATAFASLPAEAGERWREHRHYSGRHASNSDAVAAGVLGLAIGALAAGALVSNRDVVVDRNPLRHPRPRPIRDWEFDAEPGVEYYGVQSNYGREFDRWSKRWYRYCEQHYRTFDPRSGTYLGRDGREHFCLAE